MRRGLLNRRVVFMKHGIFMKRGPLVAAGLLMGASFGRVVDTMIFHQIYQWYLRLSVRMLPATFVSLRMHLFYIVVWFLFVIGLVVLWRAGRGKMFPRSGRAFIGALMVGWGLFNAVEGLVVRQLFSFDRVVEYASPVPLWDIVFMLKGVALLAIGWEFMREGRHRHDDPEKS